MRAALLAALGSALIASSAAAEDGVDRLLRAYPEHLERRDGNQLVWNDGTRMTIDDGVAGKSADELLETPDVDDMFAYVYPSAFPAAPPQTDPGRIRNAAFFQKMYGDCAAGEVSKNLVSVDWLPRHKGGRVSITRVNGVDTKLAAVSAELDALPEPLIRYLIPSAGTYNCRAIAGTRQPSAHGYGIAIDLNTAFSDYWRWPKSGWRNRIPAEVVAVFERHGFIWGGKWAHFDTMHFEYRPELLADR
ncbi:M15 family metallopeptidase [Chelatococcus sambhunathii]|uniref:M15 family metallopeptidase n=1 Tax=Chelatococcus sambhunathii TaxID=363953 RepID=A0ABU1DDF3_9HYPH|nr:M15 family metallopeptidase [Chelatococcus sambhunathii]MDR4306138.1 M15 family metallopeptidase [Chelatococcus sambhunathii]